MDTTNGTKENYKDTDFLGSELDFDNIQKPKQATIQYNQNEFKKGSYYCTAYGCFANWSSYTGIEIKKAKREIFVERCLKKGLIIDGQGGYVDKVVDEFKKFITEETGISYRYARVYSTDKDAQLEGFNIITGFLGNKEFKKDRQDNCIIDNIEWGKGTRGHCINDLDYSKVQDNYKGRDCNIYSITDFDGYVSNGNHFTFGYFFYLVTNPEMTQLEQDIADVQKAIDLGITNNKQNLEEVRRGVYSTDVKTILMIMRASRVLN